MTTPDPTPTPAQMLELFAQNIEAHQEAEAARKALGALPWPRQSDDDPELEAAQQRRVDALKRSVAVSQQALDLDPAHLRAQAAALAEREAEWERLRAGIIELRDGCATRAEVLHAAHTPDPEDYAEWQVLSSMVVALYDVLNSPAEAPK